METAAGTNGKKRPKGRLDADKQEKAIDRQVVEDKLEYLTKLHTTAKEASQDFSDAVKATAEKAGMLASVVRRYVLANAGENYIEKKREQEQLALLFEIT